MTLIWKDNQSYMSPKEIIASLNLGKNSLLKLTEAELRERSNKLVAAWLDIREGHQPRVLDAFNDLKECVKPTRVCIHGIHRGNVFDGSIIYNNTGFGVVKFMYNGNADELTLTLEQPHVRVEKMDEDAKNAIHLLNKLIEDANLYRYFKTTVQNAYVDEVYAQKAVKKNYSVLKIVCAN